MRAGTSSPRRDPPVSFRLRTGPNTHAQLESFYAVPQIEAVLVPINYRLTAEDFV